MAHYCTFKTGGNADILFLPESNEDVATAIEFCKRTRIKHFILGNGSNVLVRDKGFRGAVICLKLLKGLSFSQNICEAAAGEKLIVAAQGAVRRGLKGIEWACAIPGTIGGAVAMNAGAFGGEIGQCVERVCVLKNGKIHSYTNAQCNFSYRSSTFLNDGEAVILSARLRLEGASKNALALFAQQCNQRRKQTQPQGVLSAGSVFKRLKTQSAGELIDKCGLKGYIIGGAEISRVHANFIINARKASAQDIEKLIEYAAQQVQRQFKVLLEPEICIIGEQ